MGRRKEELNRPVYDPVTGAVLSAEQLAAKKLREGKADNTFFSLLGQALAKFTALNIEAHRAAKGEEVLKQALGEDEEEE